jgi:hypothetical protein
VRIEIRAGLGDRARGAWELTVTLPGQAPKPFANMPADADWNRLDWIGFVSLRDGPGVFHLDNLDLVNDNP